MSTGSRNDLVPHVLDNVWDRMKEDVLLADIACINTFKC